MPAAPSHARRLLQARATVLDAGRVWRSPSMARRYPVYWQAVPSICSCAANIVTCGILPLLACFLASSR